MTKNKKTIYKSQCKNRIENLHVHTRRHLLSLMQLHTHTRAHTRIRAYSCTHTHMQEQDMELYCKL